MLAFASPVLLAQADTPAPVLITLASDNTEAKLHIQLGIRDLLMGWDEMARIHFHAAIAEDEDSALARCGLMLTEGATEEHRSALEQILANDVILTPQETALLTSWLRIIQGSPIGAGEEFAERAEQYRNDTLAACWAIRLLHDRYEDISGKPMPHQCRALKLASEFRERKLQDSLIAYLRGWVEESAPSVSDEALEAARYAAQTMPEHPSSHLLYAHLLFRKGKIQDAISELRMASSCATTARKNVPHGTFSHLDSVAHFPLEIRAKLYESTLLWLDNQQKESLAIQSELLNMASSVAVEQAVQPGAVLLHWEARSLPLRLLMLSPKMPTDAQIAAATKAATVADKSDPLHHLRDCLRFCLVARQRAASGKSQQAVRCVQSAENSLKKLEAAQETCAGQGSHVLSCWTRACEACQLAILAAKAATYADTADIWLQSLRHAYRPTTLLMPPVLPSLKTR